MKLYTNNHGDWCGTQADARKKYGKARQCVEVPTDKSNLMEFLNSHKVGATVKPQTSSPGITKPKAAIEPKEELLSPHAGSWVRWALDNLKRGQKDVAVQMLIKGLDLQALWINGDSVELKRNEEWKRQ